MSQSKRSRITVSFNAPPDRRIIQKTITVVNSSVQYFFNSQHLLFHLGKDARVFYDYLCEAMDKSSNLVTINQSLKNRFAAHYYSLTSKKKSIKASSLSTYTTKLTELGLIIPATNTRTGLYIVNPKYVFKGSNTARLKIMRNLIITRGEQGLPLKGLINCQEDEFLNIASNGNGL